MNDETPILTFNISDVAAETRLDAFLVENISNWSRARLQALITNGDITVNGRAVKSSYRLRDGDEIEVELIEADTAKFEPENIALNVVFEDEHLVVIDKPAGMVVHPGSGIQSGTLANAIAFHFLEPAGANSSDAAKSNRVGIVHRLDKDTSGLIVVARNEQIHEALSAQFRNRTVFKSYVALVHGMIAGKAGKIDRPMARDRWHRTKMTVAANGRNAVSLWSVRRRFEKFTLVDVEIKTGRTHQIRVHLASLNHPIVGDLIYNEGRDNTVNDVILRNSIARLERFFLHAEKLSFSHPVTLERMEFVLPIPEELQRFLDQIPV